MALPIPILDDKDFAQLESDARSLIPARSPQWTDFNYSDPGITFLELFAWLTEVQQYRLNRTSKSGYDRMLALAGIDPAGLQPAIVRVEVQPDRAALLPANSRVTAVGKEEIPFESLRDVFLTKASLAQVVTSSGGKETRITAEQLRTTGHFDAFGTNSQIGDSLQLGFVEWFDNEVRISFTVFADDLPAVVAPSPGAPGFIPSANLAWEFLASSGVWAPLSVTADTTLGFSQSGEVIASPPGPAMQMQGLYWIRATLTGGRFEIAPRLSDIQTNIVCARQVLTIVDEFDELDKGTGRPNQVVRLKHLPLLLNDAVPAGPFQVGEILGGIPGWQALIMRLAHPDRITTSTSQPALIQYVMSQLDSAATAIILNPQLNDRTDPNFRLPNDAEVSALAQAFDALLSNSALFVPAKFPGFVALAASSPCGDCNGQSTRQLNRQLLRFVFSDLVVSDRVEIQTGKPATVVEDEPNTWINWKRVDNFLGSAPSDTHFVLDPQTGEVLFGNGLNGRVPTVDEIIRRRFYRSSGGGAGNLPSPQTWVISAAGIDLKGSGDGPARGGAGAETLDNAVFRSRKQFRAPWRAITAADFEQLARSTPGLRIANVKALPNWNPQLRSVPIPGTVTVLVLPFSNDATQTPMPSDGFLATVKNFLETRRLVTSRIYVIGPQFVTINVSAQIALKKGASAKATLARAQQALQTFLDPIRGGGPPPQTGWPFGRPVFPSEIYQLLVEVEGVDYVTRLKLNNLADQQVNLPPDGLPFPGNITLTTAADRSATAPTGRARS